MRWCRSKNYLIGRLHNLAFALIRRKRKSLFIITEKARDRGNEMMSVLWRTKRWRLRKSRSLSHWRNKPTDLSVCVSEESGDGEGGVAFDCSVSDNRVGYEPPPSPYPRSSLTLPLRIISLFRNKTPDLVPVPVQPFGYSVSDNRVGYGPPPSPYPSS